MKKKLLALSVALLLVATTLPVLAEEGGFMGVQMTNTDYGFSLALPADWFEYAFEEPQSGDGAVLLMMAADETETYWTYITAETAEGYTLETLYDALAEYGDYYEGLQFYTLDDLVFLMYEAPTDGYFGAAFIANDGQDIVYIDFEPYGDAEYTELARQILSTIQVD